MGRTPSYARSVSHYDVLGVPPTADQRAVRRAYLELARRHHPDHAGGDPARMRAANEAWATLGDPARRAAYDRMLQGRVPDHVASPPQRGTEPDPRYDPFDDIHDIDGEVDWGAGAYGVDDDDRPLRSAAVVPRWLRMIPLATFAASLAAFAAGTILTAEPLWMLGWMLLVLAGTLFISAPFVALLAAQRAERPRGDE